jgi:tetraacyldisaccharide 4'-kinase
MRQHLETFFLREWQRVSRWQILLQPLSWCFAALSKIRRIALGDARQHNANAHVATIVVGNITVGGTGKTPVVLALTQVLQEQKQGQIQGQKKAGARSVGIITRGYGGDSLQAQVIHVVPPTPGIQIRQSDEALLLAKRSGVPVVTGANRALARNELLSKHPNTQVVISDDGLQHYALTRDLEIAVVDAARGFGNGYLLPAGPLREPISRLKSVDCIILNQTENTSKDGSFEAKMPENARQMASLQTVLTASGKPIFSMHYGNETMHSLVGNASANIAEWLAHVGSKRVAAVAGIGNPPRFFSHVESLGIKLDSRHAFPDHHVFTAGDFAEIDADVILMTEKDAVKCMSFVDARMWMMRVDAILPDAFFEFVHNRLSEINDVT